MYVFPAVPLSHDVILTPPEFGYNSSKAAASHLTKMMATEFALKKIPVRVCGIAPGVYESEMTASRLAPGQVDKVGLGVMPVPVQRSGSSVISTAPDILVIHMSRRAQEMAGTVIYLVSPAGCYTNGQEIAVDGGYLCVNPSTA